MIGTREALLKLLEAHPGACQSQLAQDVGRNASTVDYHLHRLEREGKIHLERIGRKVIVWLATDPRPLPMGPPKPDLRTLPLRCAARKTRVEAYLESQGISVHAES